MLRVFISALLFCGVTASAQERGTAEKRDNISGSWILVEHFSDETHHHRMTLEVTGNKVTGQSGPSKLEGTIENSVLTFKWLSPDGQRVEATYTGKMQDGGLAGEGVWFDIKLKWSARRRTRNT